MTQKQLIKKYLESLQGAWVKSFDLRGKQTPFGFTGHQADRRARELAQAGEIEHRFNGKFAEYRAKIFTYPAILKDPQFQRIRRTLQNQINLNPIKLPPTLKSPKVEVKQSKGLF